MNKRDSIKLAIEQQKAEKHSYLRRQLAKGLITKEEYEEKIKQYC